MPPLQPDQARFLLDAVYFPALTSEHRTTVGVIEAIPADKGDYTPDPISMNALELAWHMVAAEFRFLEGVASGTFDMTPRPRPETIRNSADLAGWYEENFAPRLARLPQLTGEQLAQVLDFRGRYQWPAVMFLGRALRHTIHHRGQLSAYLRPMGAKVPAIYGQSHDSAAAQSV